MRMIDKNGHNIVVLEPAELVASVQDAMDLMATAMHNWDSASLVIQKENFSEDFFDLKTRFAGEVLQKFSNYRVRLAIVGDFSQHKSKALQDFIYECNCGSQFFWVGSMDEAVDALSMGA